MAVHVNCPTPTRTPAALQVTFINNQATGESDANALVTRLTNAASLLAVFQAAGLAAWNPNLEFATLPYLVGGLGGAGGGRRWGPATGLEGWWGKGMGAGAGWRAGGRGRAGQGRAGQGRGGRRGRCPRHKKRNPFLPGGPTSLLPTHPQNTTLPPPHPRPQTNFDGLGSGVKIVPGRRLGLQLTLKLAGMTAALGFDSSFKSTLTKTISKAVASERLWTAVRDFALAPAAGGGLFGAAAVAGAPTASIPARPAPTIPSCHPLLPPPPGHHTSQATLQRLQCNSARRLSWSAASLGTTPTFTCRQGRTCPAGVCGAGGWQGAARVTPLAC